MTDEAMKAFRQLEVEYGPIIITSAYRCEKHNKRVGGAAKSKHMLGEAFDCLVRKSQQAKFVLLAQKHGFLGIGTGENFVHIDVRDKAVSWDY